MNSILDILKQIKRGPQILHFKDLAYILLKLPSKDKLKILELGGGNGFVTISLFYFFGNKIEKYIVFEKKKDFFEILKSNIKKFIKQEFFNSLELVNEEFTINTNLNKYNTKFDVIIVDIPYFRGLINKLYKFLGEKGIIVFYILNIPQLMELIKDCKENNINIDEIVEIHYRNWIYKSIENKIILRPDNWELSHTGILVFIKNDNSTKFRR